MSMRPSSSAPLAAGAAQSSARSPLPYFLVLVLFVSAFNLGDRLLLGIVAEPIKREFGLSDTMMGLLSGTAFALVYPPLGLPLAWLSDRFNRKNILAACLALWSGMTAVTGFATGFTHLLIARIGVAVGEAGFVPPTHSLITDYVSEARRARGVFDHCGGRSCWIALGQCWRRICLRSLRMAGRILADGRPWRRTCLTDRLFVEGARARAGACAR